MSEEPINPAGNTPEQPDPNATSDKPYVPPPGASTGTYYPDELGGTMIGPYKLLQLMGKGGMGAVWMAEQTEPVRRRVAVKIIKPGYGGDQVLARFEAERQALAMMDHPNIAKVLDAGATADGKPYFVMELVKGIPFTKYCDQEHLTPAERLALFIPVCNAVQHAHQKGIIHRDLKPSNVLIALYDGKPVPKVIDFGIAKATQQKLTERTLFTEVGQIVGTLEYMAPEQAELNNLDIDTRADIYSLGVMLYELLTGAPPFSAKQLRGEAFLDMLRLIREVEPAKPSTKLSNSDDLPAIAAKRKLEPKKLSRLVQGDLDWIVMKCLEKDRLRRYESANQLGDELQRYLANEPVKARPPSVGYRTRKFLRRHKGAVIATSLILFVLVAGIIGTGIGLVVAENERAKAQRHAEELERTNKLLESILRDMGPNLDPKHQEALDSLRKRLRDQEELVKNSVHARDLAAKLDSAKAEETRLRDDILGLKLNEIMRLEKEQQTKKPKQEPAQEFDHAGYMDLKDKLTRSTDSIGKLLHGGTHPTGVYVNAGKPIVGLSDDRQVISAIITVYSKGGITRNPYETSFSFSLTKKDGVGILKVVADTALIQISSENLRITESELRQLLKSL